MIVARRTLSLTVCSISVALLAVAEVPDNRSVTVEDVVRFAAIGDPQTMVEDYGPASAAGVFSPDGQRAAVVVRRGNPSTGTNDGSLLVYNASGLFNDQSPQVVAEFSSTTNHQPIAFVRWLGPETLMFAGTRGGAIPQLYRVDVSRGQMEQVTHESTDLLWYDLTRSQQRLVVIAALPVVRPDRSPDCLLRGCLVDADSLFLAEIGEKDGTGSLSVQDLESGASRSIPALQSIDETVESCFDELLGEISPNGRFGLRLCKVKRGRWPAWWADYKFDQALQSGMTNGDSGYRLTVALLDFNEGTSRRLSDAPWRYTQPAPLWLDGGRRLIVVNALESLGGVDAKTRTLRATTQAILLVDPESGKSERIAKLDFTVSSARWDEKAQTLSVVEQASAGTPPRAMSYRRVGNRWTADVTRPKAVLPAPRALDRTDSLQLVVEQSMNQPPVLMAVNLKTQVRHKVLDPNPWLAQRRVARVEAMTWKSKDGREWSGGLYYPPAFEPGKRYPLLIQTHGFDQSIFMISGVARNFIAQPLAACNILVLQMQETGIRGVVGTPEEWPTIQTGHESAIDYLDSRGLVDRSHVGIVGWSRTGPHAAYTLTHSNYPFAAAAFTSTGQLSYWWYVAAVNSQSDMIGDYGAAPEGKGFDVLRKLSPGFNLERMHTPTIMWSNRSIAGLWDWYSGLRHNNVPVEYWYLPDGVHDVFKVPERLNTTRLLVDWFRFWLQGFEDPAAAKAEQYHRWREMQKLQQAQNSNAANPTADSPTPN
jgi:hypothetical protein